MGSSKRQRTPSRLSDRSVSILPTTTTTTNTDGIDDPLDHTPMNKASRTSATVGAGLLCTLPPTCNPPHNIPTPLANSRDLESHYGKYHAHVCEQPGCGFVFPDARLLELHQTECHDPLAALRRERGEKIFAFLTPKARRLHLIQAHSYPKEYFFAVTNKGVGGLLKRWGEGASMIRGKWTPRESKEDKVIPNGEDKGEDEMELDDDSEEEEEEEEEKEEEEKESDYEGDATPKVSQLHDFDVVSPATTPRMATAQSPRQSVAQQSSAEVEKLAQSMTSLSLVPSSIRFGRGGKGGGFVHPELHNPQVARGNFGPRGGRGRARIASNVHSLGGGHGARGGALEGGFRARGRGLARRVMPPGYVRGGFPRGRGRGSLERGK
ncbi:hypothetical protein EDD16DRAFT_1570147 [Pisolithus croceorrhizus]|nr:hypothetical protein EDD16DRAFT_1570147 [Pisolithus croceorrhizus]